MCRFLKKFNHAKIELTCEGGYAGHAPPQFILSKAHALNVRDNSDVAPAKALKQNIFNQFMKLDTEGGKE